jgi:hypothetical protein
MESIVMKTLPLVMLLLVLAGGCKKDEEPTTAPAAQVIPTELVGTWTTQGATLNGVPTPVGGALWRTKAKWGRLVLLGTGAFSVQQFDSTNTNIFDLQGNAKVVEQKITLEGTILDGASVIEYSYLNAPTWTVSGNQLLTSYYYSPLGGTVVVTWTK